MRPPRLNALKVFDAAARHHNFRVAAAELNVTQGAVAQAIRGLEADLEVSLFRRLPRGVALTEAGSSYHFEISQALAIIEQATNKLYSYVDAITVSVPPSFASKWLVPRLPYFFEANPGIEVRTIASETVTDFRTQDVHIAIRQGVRPLDEGLVATLLAPSRFCIVCGASFAADLTSEVSVETISGLPLVQDSHRHWESLLDAHGVARLDHFLQFNQTALAMDAAANGQGLAVVPRLLASDDLKAGRLVEVLAVDHQSETGFWLVHPNDDPPNRKARSSFVDWLLADVESHAAPAPG